MNMITLSKTFFAQSGSKLAAHSVTCDNGVNYSAVIRGDHEFDNEEGMFVPVARGYQKSDDTCSFQYTNAIFIR